MKAKLLPYKYIYRLMKKLKFLVIRPSHAGKKGLEDKFDKILRVTYVNSNKIGFSQIMKDGRSQKLVDTSSVTTKI